MRYPLLAVAFLFALSACDSAGDKDPYSELYGVWVQDSENYVMEITRDSIFWYVWSPPVTSSQDGPAECYGWRTHKINDLTARAVYFQFNHEESIWHYRLERGRLFWSNEYFDFEFIRRDNYEISPLCILNDQGELIPDRITTP